MKQIIVGFFMLFIGLSLVLFTPDYSKSVGSTSIETCQIRELDCIDGSREVVTDGIETNTTYFVMSVAGLLLILTSFPYLARQSYNHFLRHKV